MRIREGLTFNDVLLQPKYSEVRSRKEVDLTTNLTKNITLKMPLISSNMDTVTEDKMAIALAMNGGLGIIHRFLSIDDEVMLVKRVKRHISYIITNPYTISADKTVKDYNFLVKEKGVKGYPVVSQDGTLEGIITGRDILFYEDTTQISEVMTRFEKLTYLPVNEKSDIDNIVLDDVLEIMKNARVEKLPIVDNSNKLVGLITIRDLKHYAKINKVSTIDEKGRLKVGAAVGVKPEDIERVDALIEAGVDVLVVDIAHGHHILGSEMIRMIKSKYPDIDVIAGNVATAEGTRYLIEAGADAVKVGIGNGSICITRMITGCGVPQLTALIDCVEEARKYNIPVISDGGNGGVIGNIVKAFATGASVVMLGNFLAGTDESPGQILIKDNKRVKIVRGMSGYGANISRRQNIENREDVSDVIPEGVEGYVQYKGSVNDVLAQVCGGIRSGMSYNGAMNLKDLSNDPIFIKITDAGRKNSDHHSMNKI